jgi:hypothetical protein
MTHNPYAVEIRKPLTAKQKLQMFVEAGGICCVCGFKIDGVKEAWDEHINPLWLNGDNSAPNRAPAHEKCARAKTSGEAEVRAKIRNTAEKHFGAKKPKSSLSKKPGTKFNWRSGKYERTP